MPWTDDFATGHPEIDRQHRILFGLIDKLCAGGGDSFDDGVQVVLDLLKYVIQHFGYEEDLMTRSAYPEREAHLAAHAALNRSVVRLREDIVSGTIDNAALRRFLDNWLQHHIGENDRRLAQFLVQRGC